jgi:hypothetical protein
MIARAMRSGSTDMRCSYADGFGLLYGDAAPALVLELVVRR